MPTLPLSRPKIWAGSCDAWSLYSSTFLARCNIVFKFCCIRVQLASSSCVKLVDKKVLSINLRQACWKLAADLLSSSRSKRCKHVLTHQACSKLAANWNVKFYTHSPSEQDRFKYTPPPPQWFSFPTSQTLYFLCSLGWRSVTKCGGKIKIIGKQNEGKCLQDKLGHRY